MVRETPDVSRLLSALVNYDVSFVLTGSVAVQAWGAEIGTPGDLDIIPATDEINLRKLRQALESVQAVPYPVTGEWASTAEGFEWREFEEGDARRNEVPPLLDPLNPETFDTLYATTYGALDIVPMISGIYADIVLRISTRTVHGVPDIQVLGIEDLLAQLTIPRRKKDATRVAYLRKLQR